MNTTMLTRQLNIKNINPQKLGYILKDGTINFQSESSAFNFARNIVDKALKSKEPFERMVIWKGSRVHLIADGTAQSVNLPKITIPIGASSMHGITTLPGEDINNISTKNKIVKMYKKNKAVGKM